MELYQAADKALANLGAVGVQPPYSGVSLALVNPVTGKVGASVDRDGNLLDAEGAPLLRGAEQTFTAAQKAAARTNLGLVDVVAVEPGDIANCKFWVSADAVDSVEGGTVSSWADSGPDGHDLVLRRGTPVFQNNILNGKPGVLFAGGDLMTDVFLNASFNTALTIIVLSTYSSGTQGAFFGAVGSDGDGSPAPIASGIFGGARDSALGQFFVGGAGNVSVSSAQPAGTPMCDVFRYDGTEVSLRHNRQNLLPTAATAAIGFTDGRFVVGSGGVNTGSGWDHLGHIFEVAVFNRALTDAEVCSVEQHFLEKYNILNKPRVVFVGDSIFTQNGAVATHPPQGAMGLLSAGYDYDVAVLSADGYTMHLHGPAFGALVDECVMPGDNVTVICELGLNDLNTAELTEEELWEEVQVWGLARKAAGVARLLLHTISPGDPTIVNVTVPDFEADRDAYNTILRSDYADAGADGIVDIAATSGIGAETDTYDGTPGTVPSTNYYDGIHPTTAGVVIWSATMAAAIQSAIAADQETNYNLSVYGVGSAYALTDTAAVINLGTTDPVQVLDKAGTYLVFAQVNLAYNGATVVAQTAAIKVRRTNNTAADVSAVVAIDLPVSTTLTHTLGTFAIPPFVYTTGNNDDSLSIFANVSAALGAGTIDATAIGTSLVAIRLF